MVGLRRIHYHFLPHFFGDPAFADAAVGISRNQVHHRAHALSLASLFIYLQTLVLVTVALYVVNWRSPQILGETIFSASEIIALTNQKRAADGLVELIYNPLLARAAQAKAEDMFSNNYWAHNSPTGITPWSFITAAGYKYVFAGENLARDFNNPRSAVEAWMDSPSHRSNLLDKNFREIGVAVSSGKLTGREGILVVQMFGTSVGGVPASRVEQVAVRGSQSTENQSATGGEVTTVAPSESSIVVLSGRQFSISKAISFGLVGFIFLLFLIEVIVTLKRANVYLRPGVLAHLLVLGFLLFAVWYAVRGAIL